MFKKIKTYFLENIDEIAASIALASGSDVRPYIQ